eukprot:GHVP01065428.1.p1 GENE.GHVP01065428.1~~GHVP01065428.1.p1  ORF type:complete len:1020 (-),score=220.59 GHVP01065428.1:270-3329(-)
MGFAGLGKRKENDINVGILLNETDKHLSEDRFRISNEEVFLACKSIIEEFEKCEDLHKNRIISLVLNNLHAISKDLKTESQNVELSLSNSFSLCVSLIEKIDKEKRNEYTKPRILLADTLNGLLDNLTRSHEDFDSKILVEGILKTATCLLDSPEASKNQDLRVRVARILCLVIGKHNYIERMINIIYQSFTLIEHQTNFYAELVCMVEKNYGDISFGEKVICELCSISGEGIGPKAVSEFLQKLSSLSPETIIRSLSSVLLMLEGDSHYIRGAAIDMVAVILIEKKRTEELIDEEQSDDLLSMLEERLMDTYSYVRVRSIGAYIEICKERGFSINQRQTLPDILKERLRDKSSNVRKKAISFFNYFLTMNPFHVDGGSVSLETLEEKERMIKEYIETLDEEEITEEQRGMFSTQLAYYGHAILFSKQMMEVTETIGDLLGSELKTEVLEALDFVTNAYMFGVSGSIIQLQKALHLVWVQDGSVSGEIGARKSIREHSVDSFMRLLVTEEDPRLTAENIVCFIENISRSELSSFGEILVLAQKTNKRLNKSIPVLWEMVRERHSTVERRIQCFIILSILTKEDKKSIEENTEALFYFMFDKNNNYSQYAAPILQNLFSDGQKFGSESVIFGMIKKYLLEADLIDIPGVEELTKVVYKSCTEPEKLVEEVLYYLIETYQNGGVENRIIPLILSIGSISCVLQSSLIEETEKKRRGSEEDSPEEREEDCRVLSEIRERALLYSEESIFSIVAKLSIELCTEENLFIKRSAVIAIARFISVSSEFCKENISRIRYICKTSKDKETKCTLLVSFIDIAMQHNKIFDDNVSILISELQDEDPQVRQTALLVVSRLAMNDFLKLRGRLAEIAECLEDSDERVREITQKFFKEINRKKDEIYNGIIEALGNISSRIGNEEYKRISKFLFSFIQKEAQIESIAERLCQRMKETDIEAASERLSICLSFIQFNEKTSKLVLGSISERTSITKMMASNYEAIAGKLIRAAKTKETVDEIIKVLEKIEVY